MSLLNENALKKISVALAQRVRSARLQKKLTKSAPALNPITIAKNGDLLFGGEKVGRFVYSVNGWTQENLSHLGRLSEPYLLKLQARKLLPKKFNHYYLNELKIDFDDNKGAWFGSLALQTFIKEKVKGPALIRGQASAFDIDPLTHKRRQADLIRFYENNGFTVMKDDGHYDMIYMVIP